MSGRPSFTFSEYDVKDALSCSYCSCGLTPVVEISDAAIAELREAGLKCNFCIYLTGEVFRGPYSEYLRSPIWESIRSAAIDRADNRCQVCNSDLLLQVHHRKYPDLLGCESASDLTVLCRRCHDLFHNGARK